jgi:uncharacterized protein (DUF1778 family)
MKPKSVRKKKASKKKMTAKVGRPRTAKSYVPLGIRATIEERDFIDEAKDLEAKRLGLVPSRNNFCLRAILAAAKEEKDRTDNVSSTNF